MKLIRTTLAGVVAIGAGAILAMGTPERAEAQNCSATVTDVDFGLPDPLAGDAVDALATVHVRCNNIPLPQLVKMCMSVGSGAGGAGSGVRYMVGPQGQKLAYQLYQDASRTLIWGPSGGGEGAVPGVLLGTGVFVPSERNVTMYARLFPNQSEAPIGLYESAFSGAEVSFYWRTISVVGADTDCDGFSATHTLHPTFEVRTLLIPSCRIDATDLAFGQVGVFEAPVLSRSQLTVTCSSGAAFSIGLDDGQSGTTERAMTSGSGDRVTYDLYRDEAHTLPWGTAPADSYQGTGAGIQQIVPVFGQVPVQRTPPPGSYRDRITAIVTY